MDSPPSVTDLLTRQFYDWEQRGRGWDVWSEPVDIEPPFRPFLGHFLPPRAIVDDGEFESPLSRLAGRLLGKSVAAPPVIPPTEEEPEPMSIPDRDHLSELQILVPRDLDTNISDFQQFLRSVSACREPIAFEFIGQPGQITTQFAAHSDDVSLLRRQFRAFFPDAALLPADCGLLSAWQQRDDDECAIVEFGLAHEFMRPLAEMSLDPYVALLGALSELHEGEIAVLQIIFAPVQNPWAESVMRAVTDNEGGHFFVNAPRLVKEAERKISQPLYAAVVRLATKSAHFDRTWEIARHVAGALCVFGDPAGNELIPLTNDEYPLADHEADLLQRQSRRLGMLLNAEELTGFVHLPSAAVNIPSLRRLTGKTKPVPVIVQRRDGLTLGYNIHGGESAPVRLSAEQRVRHCHMIGASGTGKSTLLFNIIRQDIENGEGIAVLDPHGDLIDRILGVIPERRFNDVILVDPSDEEYSIPFNVLSAHSDLEKTLLASDLVSVFRRLSTSWGDQMGSVLQNAILAFLESSQGGTLAELRRFLLGPAFRAKFLQTVRDPEVLYYWQHAFAQLSGNKSLGPVLTRLETFLAPKPIRYMVSQRENRLDFAEIMDTGKILLAKLPQGLLGKENSYLLGTLLVAKFQQTAMSRQAKQIAARRDFWISIDEFHNFITPSMGEIVSGARKYRVGLTLAHQELRQLQQDMEVGSAVLSNSYTRIVFRVGDDDARKLAEGFAFFEAGDLQNLPIGQAICRVERSDCDFNLTVPLLDEPDQAEAAERRRLITTLSREKYGTPRAGLEAQLATQVESPPAIKPASPPQKIAPKPTPTLPVSEIPERLEIPMPTGSGKELDGSPRQPEPPRDLGRGGAQHKAIQERIQIEAHALGFLATVEGQLAGTSNEAADLMLKKGDETIAVEISVTTTIDHEFGNVKKCLSAGFNRVAVISHRPEHLKAIAEAVKAGLGSPQAANVTYHSPDEFIAELRTQAQEAAKSAKPPVPQESTTRGYKVRGHSPTLTVAERKAKEDMAIKLMAETMKRRA